MFVVLPLESDLAVFVGEQPPIGYGDAVRVAAQVFDGLLRTAKRRFRVYRFEIAEEGEFSTLKSPIERFEEQAAEQAGEDVHRKKEARTARDPPLAIGRKTSAGHDAMQMRVMQKILPPLTIGGD